MTDMLTMTEHKPECPMSDDQWPKHPLEKCHYCDMIRACEQRVRLEDDDYSYVAAQAEADGRRRGWANALEAALEAVKTLSIINDHPDVPDLLRRVHVLSAIGQLKEDE